MPVSLDRARGAFLGSLCGDAAGAVLEFMGRTPTLADVDGALRFPGGGVWRVAPGQVTDDGELTLALARSLVGEVSYPRDLVADAYRRWYDSPPFDVGNATRTAFSGHRGQPVEGLGDRVAGQSALGNHATKANGSLMRASGLGVWTWRLTREEAAEAARTDARLSHPTNACQNAGAAYVVAIRALVLGGGAAQAFADARAVVRDAEVAGWLEDAEAGRLPPCTPLDGFVRIAFTHAFGHLLRGSSWEAAVREVLAGGGDTDTNACIVGGLVGALHGEEGIPLHARRAVLEVNVTAGRPRPGWLVPSDARALAEALCAP